MFHTFAKGHIPVSHETESTPTFRTFIHLQRSEQVILFNIKKHIRLIDFESREGV